MAKAYRIKNWNEFYENNRTRKMKFMQWVPVQNKHDGDGYIELISGEDGAEILGAWLVVLQVASKCAIRGTLVRSSGHPHDSASISAITRIPQQSIQKALEKCSSRSVGWLEVFDIPEVASSCHEERTLSAPSAHLTDEERNGTEENRIEEPPIPQGGTHSGDGTPGLREDVDRREAMRPEFRAAWDAIERWCRIATRYPLRQGINLERDIWQLLDALDDQPPILHGNSHVAQRMLIPLAVDALIAEKVQYKGGTSLKYPCRCIQNKLDEWAKAGVRDSKSAKDTGAPAKSMKDFAAADALVNNRLKKSEEQDAARIFAETQRRHEMAKSGGGK